MHREVDGDGLRNEGYIGRMEAQKGVWLGKGCTIE